MLLLILAVIVLLLHGVALDRLLRFTGLLRRVLARGLPDDRCRGGQEGAQGDGEDPQSHASIHGGPPSVRLGVGGPDCITVIVSGDARRGPRRSPRSPRRPAV